jgi:prepilin-type N-terminal cleavage/methylation domain-containing protein
MKKVKGKRLKGRSPAQLASGFTLLEILVAVMIVGIFSAIAAPSWISFVNQRRLNAVNDAVLRELQSAQREAIKKKLSYSVSFKTENTAPGNVPKVAIHLGTVPACSVSNDHWKPLGADLEIKPGQIWMGTNLNGKNTTGPSVSVPPSMPSCTTPTTITFDEMSALPLGSSTGLKIVVAVPPSGNSTQPSNSTKRCVIVETLLGSMRTARGNDCN